MRPTLEDWQRDILLIVREEMLYFVPQMQTKILNEGWASLDTRADHARDGPHRRRVRRLRADARRCAGGLAHAHQSRISLGYRILEDIERRWDNPTEEERASWAALPGQGRAKLFEVRETESDVSLLRNYLTKDLVEELDLYLYAKRATSGSSSRRTGRRCATASSPA